MTHLLWMMGNLYWNIITLDIDGLRDTSHWLRLHCTHAGKQVKRPTYTFRFVLTALFGLILTIGICFTLSLIIGKSLRLL